MWCLALTTELQTDPLYFNFVIFVLSVRGASFLSTVPGTTVSNERIYAYADLDTVCISLAIWIVNAV